MINFLFTVHYKNYTIDILYIRITTNFVCTILYITEIYATDISCPRIRVHIYTHKANPMCNCTIQLFQYACGGPYCSVCKEDGVSTHLFDKFLVSQYGF